MKKNVFKGLLTYVIALAFVCTASVTANAAETDVEIIEFSKGSGCYSQSFNLTMTVPSGYKIYYTTDCSDPVVGDKSTKLYSGSIKIQTLKGSTPFLANYDKSYKYVIDSGTYNPDQTKLDRATIIRAISVSPTGEVSPISTKTYFIGNDIEKAYKNCAVMSIVTDPDNLVDDKIGIYVYGSAYDGKDVDTANFYQHGKEWERESYMDFFENNGSDTPDVSRGVGIRIHGGYSRRDQQKSLNVYFREEYDFGKKNLKEYNLFPESKTIYKAGKTEPVAITNIKNTMLRTGGNDAGGTKFQDVFIQSMLTDKNFTVQYARPCMVYLNGEYWGLYNLTEKYSDKYVEEKFDVDNNNVLIYKNMEVDEGEDFAGEALQELMDLGDLDMTLEKNYKKFQEIVDIDSYVDYYAAEIYICNNDWWSGCNDENQYNNIQFWKVMDPSMEDESNPYADGRWRYMLFDTEWSMGLFSSNEASANYDSLRNHAMGADRNYNGDPVFIALMENKDFQKRMTEALLQLRNWNFQYDRASKALDDYTDLYTSLMDKNRERWNSGDIPSNVTRMKNFLKERQNYVLTIIENNMDDYSKSDRVDLALCANIWGEDYVHINSVLPDISKTWYAVYYKDTTIDVKAEKKSDDYTFDHWELKGATAVNAKSEETTITLTDSDAVVRAIYKDSKGNIPVPSATPKPTPSPTPNPWGGWGDPWGNGGGGWWPWPGQATATPEPTKAPRPTKAPGATQEPSATNTPADVAPTANPTATATPPVGSSDDKTQTPGLDEKNPSVSDKGDSANDPAEVVSDKIANIKKFKLKYKGKKVNLSWKKVNGITGYQIKYATNKKLTKNANIINVRKPKYVIKKLTAKKKYYVSVRAFVLTEDLKLVYGKWSTKKTMRIK